MSDQYDPNQQQQQQAVQYEQGAQEEEGQTNPVVKILIYVGILAVINVVLIAVDAPFYIC